MPNMLRAFYLMDEENEYATCQIIPFYFQIVEFLSRFFFKSNKDSVMEETKRKEESSNNSSSSSRQPLPILLIREPRKIENTKVPCEWVSKRCGIFPSQLVNKLKPTRKGKEPAHLYDDNESSLYNNNAETVCNCRQRKQLRRQQKIEEENMLNDFYTFYGENMFNSY